LEKTFGGIRLKFSVLIPVYNTEKYLEECLQSVLDQTYQDFEIILVDDGSTDNSGVICDKFQCDFPETIKVIHKENQGLISARRVGIANATGDYCIFVDSDDYIEKELLNELSRVLSQDEAIDVLIYSFKYVQDGKVVKQYSQIAQDGTVWDESNRKDIIEKLLFSNDVTPIWIKAIKASLLKSDPTDYSQFYKKNMAEDHLQSLYLITYAKKIVYYYLPLYCYSYNFTSISRNYTYSAIEKQNKIHVYSVLMEYLKLWKMDDTETIRRINARWFNDTMYLFFKCYENAKTKSDRKEILNFNWDSMLPNNNVSSISKYANNDYCKIYDYWRKGSFKQIDRFFTRRKVYKKVRHIKRVVFN